MNLALTNASGAAEVTSGGPPDPAYIGEVVLPLAFGAGPHNATVTGIDAITGRVTVFIATRRFNNSPFTSAVTIGGATATQRDFIRTGIHQEVSIWDAEVTAGGGDVVAVTVSGTLDRLGVAAWDVTGRSFVDAATASSATVATMNLALTNASGAAVVAGVLAGAAANTFTWAEATENFDGTLEAPTSMGAALNTSASSNVTVTVTPAGTNTDFLAIAAAYE